MSTLRCVIDASVCLKYFIPDPLSAQVDQLLEHLIIPETAIYIPDLFYIECANAFWKYARAGQLTAEQVRVNLRTLKAFPLRVVSTAELMEETVNVSLTYGITAYDACYVVLSQQVKAPLLTLDQKLFNSLDSSSYDVQLFTSFTIPDLE